MIARRNALLGAALAFLASARARAATGPTITVTKDPNCGCCSGWVEHLRQAGFDVQVKDVPDVNRVKARLGVPTDLTACHTAEVAGYVIEGHVPAAALRRFLSEKPDAKGLAVKGMPVGSPGMEVADATPEEYEVILFGPKRRRTYARFRETTELHQQ